MPLFATLPEGDLIAFAELVRERSYPKGSVILFEDDPGDALYLVAAGQVKVVLIGEDGREVILSVLGEGSFFGEMALIDDQPRSAHVIAMTDAAVLVLRREDFQATAAQLPGGGDRAAAGALPPAAPRRREDRQPGAARRERPGCGPAAPPGRRGGRRDASPRRSPTTSSRR